MKSTELHISIIGAFFATLLASFFSYQILDVDASPLVLASTGASAMLIFGLPHSPVSRPWNLVGGHLASAFVGICCYKLIPHPVFASSCAIPVAMFLMHHLRCMHPPGGATAITAVIGGASVHELGFSFMVIPVFFNSIILLSMAIAAGSFRENNPFEVKQSEITPH